MIENKLLVGFVGAVIGFFVKTLIDFYISSNKDALKDLKQNLFESFKVVDSISDQLGKDLFELYSSSSFEDKIKDFKILRINNDFKHLGVCVNGINRALMENSGCSNRFEHELLQFRSAATRDIHNSGNADFDSFEKIREIHSAYIRLKNKIFAIKCEISIYQISDHTAFNFKKIKSRLSS